LKKTLGLKAGSGKLKMYLRLGGRGGGSVVDTGGLK